MPATDARSHPSVALRLLGVVIAGCLAVVGSYAIAPTARGAAATRAVGYRGYQITVPAGWPVYRLSAHTVTCVRFDRHAVYLGAPSADQNCPAHAAGRTEAILVSPLPAGVAGRTNGLSESAAVQPALPEGGSSTQLSERSHHVLVTATWDRQPAIIRQALGVRALPSAGHSPSAGIAAANAMRRLPSIRSARRGGPRLAARSGLHGHRLRCLRNPKLLADVGVGCVELSGDRRLHRGDEHGLRAAEPELGVGQQPVGGRVAPDPHLCRTAGTVELVRMRGDHPRARGRPGLRGGA